MMMRVLLAVALVVSVGGLSTVTWMALHQEPAPKMAYAPLPAETETSVIVALMPLHAGQLIRADELDARRFPSRAVAPGAIPDTADARRELTGALLRVSVPAGGLLLSEEVVRPGDHGYLAAVLTPGKRAVSVGVDAVSGIAGLVWPGDYVDLILTQTIDEQNVPISHRMAAETVLTGLRVIATDQDLVRGEKPASAGEAQRTITLEATPEEAERILVASRLGRLSLSICPLAECGDHRTSHEVTWGGDLSSALADTGSATGNGQVVHFYDGASDQKDFHF